MKVYKTMSNAEIVELLRSVAAAYQIKGKEKNKFKVIAYERAADAVEHLSSEAKDLWDDKKLEDVPGIGPSIAKHLGEIFSKGVSSHFTEVMEGLPAAVFELLKISGVGPSTALQLVDQLTITSKNPIGQLLKAAEAGKIAPLDNFGEDSQKAIIASIKEITGREKRLLLNYATALSEEIVEWMKKESTVLDINVLGSLRRKAATIGDLDLAAASNNPQKTIDHFTKYPNATRVLEKGTRTASVILPGNHQVDLMVESPSGYGALLQHFTGSKHHNIALRENAQKKDLSVSDYGIWLKKGKAKTLKKFADEKSFYNFLEMAWIPPELRENTGEIEAAKNEFLGKTPGLPNLVDLRDIKSDLQIHSDFDIETSHDLGESSMEEIIAEANRLGYTHLAFTEHNPSQKGHSDKQTLEILKRKREKIDVINYSLRDRKYKCIKKVYNSLEIDILPTGRLPVSDRALATLDFALVSIHSSFKQEKTKATQRVIDGLNHPKVKIFAHPTGRKLNEREGVDLDWATILDFCVTHHKLLEINADPMRLDLPDFLVREAVKKDVFLTLGTDAHHKDSLSNMIWGVSVARRGWAETRNVINTFNIVDFEKIVLN